MFLGLVSYEKTPKMQCGERALCCTGKTQGPYLATARSQQEGSHWHQEGRGQPLDCEKFCQVAFFYLYYTQGLFAKQPLAGEVLKALHSLSGQGRQSEP